jgi:hypothetical protein
LEWSLVESGGKEVIVCRRERRYEREWKVGMVWFIKRRAPTERCVHNVLDDGNPLANREGRKKRNGDGLEDHVALIAPYGVMWRCERVMLFSCFNHQDRKITKRGYKMSI